MGLVLVSYPCHQVVTVAELTGPGPDLVTSVQVIMAKGLRAADANGLSDPFCRVIVGKRRVQTKVIFETLTPRWDETFVFSSREVAACEEGGDGMLRFQIWDRDTFTKDFLGQVLHRSIMTEEGRNSYSKRFMNFRVRLSGVFGKYRVVLEFITIGISWPEHPW